MPDPYDFLSEPFFESQKLYRSKFILNLTQNGKLLKDPSLKELQIK